MFNESTVYNWVFCLSTYNWYHFTGRKRYDYRVEAMSFTVDGHESFYAVVWSDGWSDNWVVIVTLTRHYQLVYTYTAWGRFCFADHLQLVIRPYSKCTTGRHETAHNGALHTLVIKRFRSEIHYKIYNIALFLRFTKPLCTDIRLMTTAWLAEPQSLGKTVVTIQTRNGCVNVHL